MKYKELMNLFWDATNIMAGEWVKKPADRWIRWKYPTTSGPDWKIDDTVIFMNLSERDDPYAQQNDSMYVTENDRVIRKRGRTRVWNLLFTVYGPEAFDVINHIKDGVFTNKVHDLLSKNDVFLIPDIPASRQLMEPYDGMWWNRYDLTLHFNEWYEAPDEDAGRIDTLSLSATIQT